MNNYLKFFCLALLGFVLIQGNINGDQPAIRIEEVSPVQKSLGMTGLVMYFDNFPRNQNIKIMHNRPSISKDFQKLDIIKINSDESIHINGKNFIFYTFGNNIFIPGETINFQYELDNGTILAEASFIIRPLMFISKYGTFYVEVELKSINPTIYKFEFHGPVDNETLHLSSLSCLELLENDFVYHSKQLYMPGVINEYGGVANVKISRQSGDYVYFHLDWGISIMEKMLKNLKIKDGAFRI